MRLPGDGAQRAGVRTLRRRGVLVTDFTDLHPPGRRRAAARS